MGETPNILVVDDQISVINSLIRLFKRKKYNILSANDASQAIKIVTDKKNNIALIISDQRMPGTTGTELADQLKNQLKINIPVIILSGYSDMSEIQQAIKNNTITLFIEKPWDNDALITEVEKILHPNDNTRSNEPTDTDSLITDGIGVNAIDTPSDIISEIKTFSEDWYDKLFGKIAVKNRFITQQQLDIAIKRLEEAKKSGRNVSIENILYENKFIDSETMGKLMASTKRIAGKSFCYTAINKNMITMDDMERVLNIQSHEFNETSTCRLVGDILISEGLLSQEERDLIVIDQYFSENTSDNPLDESKEEIEKKKHAFFLKERAMDKLFGQLAIKKKYAREDEILTAMNEQLTGFSNYGIVKKVGEILVDQGNLSSERNSELLTLQKRLFLKNAFDESDEPHLTTLYTGYDKEFELKISSDKMTAFCAKTDTFDGTYSVDEFKVFLKKSGIVYGIVNDKKLNHFLTNDRNQNEHILIAKGKELFRGRKSFVKPLFAIDYLDAGKKDAKGTMDFKERGRIPFVEPDVVLAEIIPPIQGQPGITIFGEVIEAEKYEPVEFIRGEGVYVDPNGLYLLSEISGQPVLGHDSQISVLPLKSIDGDVDFHTGHVVFEGNVEVKGCLQSGFLIKAANVSVEEINGGIIKASGDVNVQNGIIGGNVWSKGTINAGYINDANVVAYHDIIVKSLIIDSELISGGSLLAEGCKTVSSDIFTRTGGLIKNVGTTVSSPCKINIGSDAFLDYEMEHFKKSIKFYTEKLQEAKNISAKLTKENKALKITHNELTLSREKLDMGKQTVLPKINKSGPEERRKHETMLQKITKMTIDSDRELEKIYKKQTKVFGAIAKVNHWITEYSEKLKSLENDKNSFSAWAKSKSTNASLTIKGTLSVDTILEGKNATKVVKEDVRNVIIKEVFASDQQGRGLYNIAIESSGKQR